MLGTAAMSTMSTREPNVLGCLSKLEDSIANYDVLRHGQ